MPVFTNGIEAYNKKALSDEVRRLTTANIQLVSDKIKTEKTKVNLKADRIWLFDEKNSLIAKRKEFRTEIVILNVVGLFNIPIRGYQDPFLKLIQNKLKVKRPPSFDNLKKNFQRFFIRTQYYQRFYQ